MTRLFDTVRGTKARMCSRIRPRAPRSGAPPQASWRVVAADTGRSGGDLPVPGERISPAVVGRVPGTTGRSDLRAVGSVADQEWPDHRGSSASVHREMRFGRLVSAGGPGGRCGHAAGVSAAGLRHGAAAGCPPNPHPRRCGPGTAPHGAAAVLRAAWLGRLWAALLFHSRTARDSVVPAPAPGRATADRRIRTRPAAPDHLQHSPVAPGGTGGPEASVR